jgi:hypothetical protein
LTERANIGTVQILRAGARIGVIGGKGKEGYGHRLPVFIPHIAPLVKLLRSVWVKIARRLQAKRSISGRTDCNALETFSHEALVTYVTIFRLTL